MTGTFWAIIVACGVVSGALALPWLSVGSAVACAALGTTIAYAALTWLTD
jgi:hypothetical protein